MTRVEVSPLHSLWGLVVLADVAYEFLAQVGDRGKDAASANVTLDLAEPQFDLVEPGRVGRGEVQMDIGVALQEVADLVGLVRREVVCDHVNLLAARLIDDNVRQEGDELGRSVPRRGLA